MFDFDHDGRIGIFDTWATFEAFDIYRDYCRIKDQIAREAEAERINRQKEYERLKTVQKIREKWFAEVNALEALNKDMQKKLDSEEQIIRNKHETEKKNEENLIRQEISFLENRAAQLKEQLSIAEMFHTECQ